MASARRLYGLALGLGVAAILVVVFAWVAAAMSMSLAAPPSAAVKAACRQLGLPTLSVGGVLVLALVGLGVAVLILGARSAIRQIREQRRFLSGLHVVDSLDDGPRRLVVGEGTMQAFCAGYLRPRVYVSTGALERLQGDELDAVLAHEAHHALRRDPLRILIVQVLSDALFFLPAMRRLRIRYATLAELAADRAAVGLSGDAAPLASAMLSFESASPAVVGIEPERVDHLMGESPRWQIPLTVAIGAVVTLATLTAVSFAIFAAHATSAVNVPLLLAQSCMLVMLAGPILLALGLVVLTSGSWRRLVRRPA